MTLFGERRTIQVLQFLGQNNILSFDIVDMFLQFVQHVKE